METDKPTSPAMWTFYATYFLQTACNNRPNGSPNLINAQFPKFRSKPSPIRIEVELHGAPESRLMKNNWSQNVTIFVWNQTVYHTLHSPRPTPTPPAPSPIPIPITITLPVPLSLPHS